MAASRSSSGVPLPWPISRSSSPTVATSSGPIVVLISIRRLLPSVASRAPCSNTCSISGGPESSPLAEPVDGQDEGGQQGRDGPGGGGPAPAVGPRHQAPPTGRPGRRRGRDPGQPGRGQRFRDGRPVAPDELGWPGEQGGHARRADVARQPPAAPDRPSGPEAPVE